MQTTAPTLAMNHCYNDHNRRHPLNQWARREPRKDSWIYVQFSSGVCFWNTTPTLFVVFVRTWPLATCFCAVGRTFDDITQKASTHGAVVCGSGHFPQHHRLHKDHYTTLLFTVWPADELLSVVGLWSMSTVKQKNISVEAYYNGTDKTYFFLYLVHKCALLLFSWE